MHDSNSTGSVDMQVRITDKNISISCNIMFADTGAHKGGGGGIAGLQNPSKS
jgi:hypothetical protein